MTITVPDPKYKVGQLVKFDASMLSCTITVKITKATLVVDVTTKESYYKYDIKHHAVTNGWSWDNIEEKILDLANN